MKAVPMPDGLAKDINDGKVKLCDNFEIRGRQL